MSLLDRLLGRNANEDDEDCCCDVQIEAVDAETGD